MERRKIISLWREGGARALITLIRVEGSSYRRPGARILVGADGAYAGSISGGCLEAEVVRKAVWKIRDGAMVDRYSTMFDDTAEMPFGLGCGGVVDLLVEPVEAEECRALLKAMEASLRGERAVVVTYLPDGATKMWLRRVVLGVDGEVIYVSEGLSAAELDDARSLEPGQEYEGRFVEELMPTQRLIVLGVGDDAKPVVKMANLLGWRVMVADARTQLARAETFPEAERVVRLTGSIDELGVNAQDAVVMMTHSYLQDRELLPALLRIGPRYLGVLGSRQRSALLVNEAADAIGLSVAKCCERLYAPVGLDLGGDGPEAIALAVIAEAQACCQGKLGSSRRLTAKDVAVAMSKGDASRYLQAECARDN